MMGQVEARQAGRRTRGEERTEEEKRQRNAGRLPKALVKGAGKKDNAAAEERRRKGTERRMNE